jgi:hypothetical protein
MDGKRAFGQRVVSVHEQRAAIQRDTVLPLRVTLPAHASSRDTYADQGRIHQAAFTTTNQALSLFKPAGDYLAVVAGCVTPPARRNYQAPTTALPGHTAQIAILLSTVNLS